MAFKLPHWLAHRWPKWETYEQTFKIVDARFPGVQATQGRIRQRRTCEVCGKLQDRIVAELHGQY